MPLQATSGAASYDAFGGGVAAVPNYIEECFSAFLYTGNGSTQTITNGIDLSTKGGLVWLKSRSTPPGFYDGWHNLVDTVRGTNSVLHSNASSIADAYNYVVSAFNATGFTLGNGDYDANKVSNTYVSWTFRKQPKFFDVVTWTGDNTVGRQIPHNLGSVPGCIITKCLTAPENWNTYHRSLGNQTTVILNGTGAGTNFGSSLFNSTDPTSTYFTTGTSLAAINGAGRTYVAYLFAHDAGGFGLTGTDNVISCGTYSGNGSSTGPVIDLGYEPQWVMIKKSSGGTIGAGSSDWMIFDIMRGFTDSDRNDNYLNPNLASEENSLGSGNFVRPLSTGFQPTGSFDLTNQTGSTYIYIAIRRGPMKIPTVGTGVFTTDTGTNGTTNGIVPVGFRPDMSMTAYRSLGGVGVINDRLRGYGLSGNAGQTPALQTSSTANEANWASSNAYFYNAWNTTITRGSNGANPGGAGIVTWFFQRAPSVFDEVCYTRTSTQMTLNHNLGVTPELIIKKNRSRSGTYWDVMPNVSPYDYRYDIYLNDTQAISGPSTIYWGSAPTSTTFGVDMSSDGSSAGDTFVCYLFASAAGVSKVGTYTGTGALQTINCGFAAGARFVLIKRTDSTGDWYTYDSARGLTSGNDPYLLLNSSAAEVTGTNYVDTTSVGFQVTAAAPAGLNASGGTYIFLAIA